MKRQRRTKIAIAAGAGIMSSLALLGGSYAAFQAQAAAPAQQISSAVEQISMTSATSPTWTSSITGLAAGDSEVRYVNLNNGGTTTISPVYLSQTNQGTALSTSSDGVSVEFDSCSVGWTWGSNTCSGTQTTVLPTIPLYTFTSKQTLQGALASFAAGATVDLRETVTLSPNAPNSMQNLTDAVTYTFSG